MSLYYRILEGERHFLDSNILPEKNVLEPSLTLKQWLYLIRLKQSGGCDALYAYHVRRICS